MNRKHYLKERLNKTEKWIEHYLETEDHIQISRNALKQSYNETHFLISWTLKIFYLPTKIYDFIYTIIWWNRYRKACKVVEIIRKELESYDN